MSVDLSVITIWENATCLLIIRTVPCIGDWQWVPPCFIFGWHSRSRHRKLLLPCKTFTGQQYSRISPSSTRQTTLIEILGSSDIWGVAVLKRRKPLNKLFLWILTAKGWKTAYFHPKSHNYFWKHGKRINIHNNFFTPCTFRHISRVRTRARIRRFSNYVFTSSQLPLKTLCVNGLRVKASLPFFLHPCLHRKFWEFMHYAHFMRHEVINGHSAGRGRGRGGKIRKPENEVNKGWRKRRREAFTPNSL